jgi:hypothetical protein
MTRLIATALLATVCALTPSAVAAKGSCPDGRTASGRCLNPAFAESVRQTGVIYSQPKISRTHYPVLPSLDRRFRHPNELNPDQLKPSATGTVSTP